MISPSTFLRAAIYRCESAAATPEQRAPFSRLLQDARAFEMTDSAAEVVARLPLYQAPLDTVRTLVAELMVSARRSGQFLMVPGGAAGPQPNYPVQLREAAEHTALAFALLTPLFAYLARANGAAG